MTLEQLCRAIDDAAAQGGTQAQILERVTQITAQVHV